MVSSSILRRSRPSMGLLAILLLVALSLAGCKMDPNEEFIQGQWYDNNDHLANIPGESAQETYWYFDDKTFESYGCCFATQNFSGYYRIMKSDGDTLLLELYQLKGQNSDIVFNTDDKLTIEIKIDRQADTIQFGRGDSFSRVFPSP